MEIGVLIIFSAYATLFIVAEFLYHFFKINGEISRKIVHSCSGGIGLTLPFFIQNHWIILILAVFFALILFLSNKYHFLKSINSVDRVTVGSTLFPFVLYVCYFIHQAHADLIYYYLPILVLAISDPIAALVGKKLKFRPYVVFGNTKTLGGSLAFFVSSSIICSLLLIQLTNLNGTELSSMVLLISIVATLSESISVNGLDNVTVPLSILALLLMFL